MTIQLLPPPVKETSVSSTKEKYVVYNEMWSTSSPVINSLVFVKVKDVIAFQLKRTSRYKEDFGDKAEEEALQDFLIVHWAWIEER